MPTQRPFRFGIVAGQARSADEWVELARRAEAAGFSTLLIPDTLSFTFAPLPALAVLAGVTTSLRFGTYVLANDYRNPVLVAREAATLAFLSGGRFELGLGAGRPGADEDYRKLGIALEAPGVRVERMEQALAIIKPLLAGGQVAAGGVHYPVSEVDVFPRPPQNSHIPLLVAASGKRMLTLAAGVADTIALAVGFDAPASKMAATIDLLKTVAGARFEHLELNNNLIVAGQGLSPWVRDRMGIDEATLRQSDSVAVLMGTTDEMCDKLEERRAQLGLSYITMGADALDAMAPVVARLAGH